MRLAKVDDGCEKMDNSDRGDEAALYVRSVL